MIKELADAISTIQDGDAVMHPLSATARKEVFSELLTYESPYKAMVNIYMNELSELQKIQTEHALWYIRRYKYIMNKSHRYRVDQVNMALDIIAPREIIYGPA